MIDFDFENLEECNEKIKKYQEFGDKWEALSSFQFAMELIEELSACTDIVTWQISFIKTEYNDEGLGEGVYVDVSTKNKGMCSNTGWDLDYDEEYHEKAENNNSINKINAYLSGKYFETSHKYVNLIDSLQGKTFKNNQTGHLALLGQIVGKKNLKVWETSVDKKKIVKSVDTPKQDPNTPKI